MVDTYNDLIVMQEPTSNMTFSISPYPYNLRQKLTDAIRKLEGLWGRPIFLLDQTCAWEPETLRYFSEHLYSEIRDHARQLPPNPIILLNSIGGSPSTSFNLANVFRKVCGSYGVCIVKKSMSGAMLFACGADSLRMGLLAHGGPIDPQIHTLGPEYSASGLDYLRYQDYAERFFMRVTNRTLQVDSDRYSRTDIAHILHEVYQGIRVDEAQFRGAKAGRSIEGIVKYTERLLSNKYGRKAKRIAQELMFGHCDHEAPLTAEQLNLMGMQVETVSPEEQNLLDDIVRNLPNRISIGSLQPLNLPYRSEPLPLRPRGGPPSEDEASSWDGPEVPPAPSSEEQGEV